MDRYNIKCLLVLDWGGRTKKQLESLLRAYGLFDFKLVNGFRGSNISPGWYIYLTHASYFYFIKKMANKVLKFTYNGDNFPNSLMIVEYEKLNHKKLSKSLRSIGVKKEYSKTDLKVGVSDLQKEMVTA